MSLIRAYGPSADQDTQIVILLEVAEGKQEINKLNYESNALREEDLLRLDLSLGVFKEETKTKDAFGDLIVGASPREVHALRGVVREIRARRIPDVEAIVLALSMGEDDLASRLGKSKGSEGD
jgi:hypothetical protein